MTKTENTKKSDKSVKFKILFIYGCSFCKQNIYLTHQNTLLIKIYLSTRFQEKIKYKLQLCYALC